MRIEETTDADLIHRLTQAAFAEYGREPGTSTALKETREAVEGQLADENRALALFDAKKPVACVRFRFEGDALYFHRLSVDPAHRRKGYASALVGALEDCARAAGLRRLTCSVRLAQADNLALYFGLGFVQTSVRSVCRDGTPVPTGDFEKDLSPVFGGRGEIK